MTAGQIVTTRTTLICDGCSQVVGPFANAENALEARCVAFGEGWRFPAAITQAGKVTQRHDDVCPTCVPTWSPTVLGPKNARPRRTAVA